MNELRMVEGKIKVTGIGCSPMASWWKQAWADARALAPEAGDDLGLIGLTSNNTQAVFQLRGVGSFLVDLECE